MRGIVVKARRGIEAILNGLGGDIQITKITFVLVTTKSVVEKAKTFLDDGFQANGNKVECHLHDQTQTMALFNQQLQRIIGK
jgi:hypothetical protein